RVRALNAVAKGDPLGRRRIGLEILIVVRQLADLDDLERERWRRQLCESDRHFSREGFFAKTADEYGNVVWCGHAMLDGGLSTQHRARKRRARRVSELLACL